MQLWQHATCALCVCAALGLSGCAHQSEQTSATQSDPWETVNRATFAFNAQVDTYVIGPVAKSYEWLLPQGVRDGVHNVYTNLGEPANALNNALQGKGEDSLASVFRLLINTTLGLGGVFDVAGSAAGQAVRSEDFGQTLGVWGVPSGPYLVLPLLGPSSVRDATGSAVGYFTEPMTYAETGAVGWGMWGLWGIDQRVRMGPAIDLLVKAPDPYVMAREAYLSTRNNAVWDGNPPFEFPEDEFEDESSEQ